MEVDTEVELAVEVQTAEWEVGVGVCAAVAGVGEEM